MIEDELREHLAQRRQDWLGRSLQRRKYALLLVGYCRRRFHPWGTRRQALLTAAEQIAGRTFPNERMNELQEFARELLDRANQSLVLERNSLEHGHAIPIPAGTILDFLPSPDEPEAIRLLALSLHEPEQAAGELIVSPQTNLDYLRGVMDCLRPAVWEKPSGWYESQLTRDAHLWARRIYETQDYTSLPILADRLEDEGCPDRPLLDHCRSECRHYRGCAAVDRLCGYQT